MGKPVVNKKNQIGSKSMAKGASERSSKAFDEDTAIFINMSHEFKEEGNKLFHKHDHEGAMLKYEKALKLLPANHIDVAFLRTNMAACYMEMGIGEFPRAVNECDLALHVAPKYSKALLRRASCYEALQRLDLAWRDVDYVLSIEPNNSTALEIADTLKKEIEKQGLQLQGIVHLPQESTDAHVPGKVVKDKAKKKKSIKFDMKDDVEPEEKKIAVVDEPIVEEKRSVTEEKIVMKSVKLVHGEDIRWAQLPVNCSVGLVRDVVKDRFPNMKGVLMKYKDQEGDLITITTTEELRSAERLAHHQGILRLFIAEVNPGKEPCYEGMGNVDVATVKKNSNVEKKPPSIVEDWIVQFAKLFKNHVGIDSDSYLDLHELGMKLYSEAMEDTVANENAQELFQIAAEKFQEMAALALFNWGNVHLSKARKRVLITEDGSTESILTQVKEAYDWAQKEYIKAGMRYEKALKIKPDFYEGHLALGQQLFEQAKLSWYHVVGTESDEEIDIEESAQILELYNKAEDSMEKGVQIWEEIEEQRLNGLSKYQKNKEELRKYGLDNLFIDLSFDEASNQVAMRSQIYLLWGKMLYERSVVEYKLTLPTWEECLEVAIEKFELAGALPTDIAVMIKNHCSNDTALEGFKVEEIIEAWNEMHDADRWKSGAASFRLEPLFRRRSSKLHVLLENL